MAVATTRPTGATFNVSGTVGGSPSNLADDNDGTTMSTTNAAQARMRYAAPAGLPAGSVRTHIQSRLRMRSSDGFAGASGGIYGGNNITYHGAHGANYSTSLINYDTGVIAYDEATWIAQGAPILLLADGGESGSGGGIYTESWLYTTYQVPPTASALVVPSQKILTGRNIPASWTYSQVDGQAQTKYWARVFTKAYIDGGGDAYQLGNVWDSGEQNSAATAITLPPLPAGDYYLIVFVNSGNVAGYTPEATGKANKVPFTVVGGQSAMMM